MRRPKRASEVILQVGGRDIVVSRTDPTDSVDSGMAGEPDLLQRHHLARQQPQAGPQSRSTDAPVLRRRDRGRHRVARRHGGRADLGQLAVGRLYHRPVARRVRARNRVDRVFSRAGLERFDLELLVNDASDGDVLLRRRPRDQTRARHRHAARTDAPRRCRPSPHSGGMLVPALIFFAFNAGTQRVARLGHPDGDRHRLRRRGGVAARQPGATRRCKVFLLTLAIVDDIGAILVIAIFYTEGLSFRWLLTALAAAAVVVWATSSAGLVHPAVRRGRDVPVVGRLRVGRARHHRGCECSVS